MPILASILLACWFSRVVRDILPKQTHHCQAGKKPVWRSQGQIYSRTGSYTWRRDTGDRRPETGDRKQEKEDRRWLRWETGDGRQETGERRQETGDKRREMGDRRQDTGDGRGFSDVISEKFSAFNLAGESIIF